MGTIVVMKHGSCGVFALTLAAASVLFWFAPPLDAQPSQDSALVLYDSSGDWGWLGNLYAQNIANLLGHFPLNCVIQPVEQYVPGQVDEYRATFYLGSVYDNDLPAYFLEDVAASTRPVCWFKYNLWKMSWTDEGWPAPAFEEQYGFQFLGLDWSPWDRVFYGDTLFTRNAADPEVGLVEVTDPGTAQVLAWALRAPYGEPDCLTPYVVHGGNLWYVADMPFAYVSESDRYLVFCDLIHDIVGINHPQRHRALVRIEDISAETSPDRVRDIADYLYSQGVPFQLAVISGYRDPLGAAPDVNVPFNHSLTWSGELVAALRYAVDRGGVIVAHGYSHQYDSTPNPYSGQTGMDFEFYLLSLDVNDVPVYEGPVPMDSPAWATGRMTAAFHELRRAGLQPVAWEIPHYTASATDFQAFADVGGLMYHRSLCFVEADTQSLSASASRSRDARQGNSPPFDQSMRHRPILRGHDPFRGEVVVADTAGGVQYMLGQFFPYVIQRDVYGQKLAPENLGYVDPGGPGWDARLPEDIIADAQRNLAIRDGWASFYFHPFLDLSYLQELVEGIKDLGYEFAAISPDMQ